MPLELNDTLCRPSSIHIKPEPSSEYSCLIPSTPFDQCVICRDWQTQRQIAAREIVAQSRRSRGLFAWLWNGMQARSFPPTYNYRPDGSACRVYGSVEVKKVTGVVLPCYSSSLGDSFAFVDKANLHITTLGHGYAGREHTDHSCE